MSLYTVGEIIIFIVAAALIGALVGWILRSLRIGMQMASLESSWRSRYEEATGRLHTIDAQLASEASRRAELEGDHEADARLADSLHAELADRFSEVTQLREALQRSGDDLALMSGQLSERGRRITELESERAAELEAQQSELRAQTAQELEALRVENAGLRAGWEAANAQVAELDRRAAQARAEHAEEVETLQQRVAETLEVDLRDAEALDLRLGFDPPSPPELARVGRPGSATKLSAAEARQRVAEIAVRTAGGVTAPDDDLVQIHGVGPKIANLLKSMGVTSFAQVARFADDDVEAVAAALDTFRDRIRRDDWMTDAARLHRQKYGSAP